MAINLPPEVDEGAFAQLPETFKREDIFVKDEKTGKYRPAIDPASGFELANKGKIDASLQAARGERDKAQQTLKTWEATGVTPEEIEELREFREKYHGREWTPKEEVAERTAAAVKAEVTPIREAHAKDQAMLRARTEKLTALTLQTEALHMLDRGADPKLIGNPKMLMPVIHSRTKAAMKDDGSVEIHVLHPDGQTVKYVEKDGESRPATIADLVRELSNDPDFAVAFRGPDAAGAGSRSSGSSGGGDNFSSIVNPAERLAARRAAQG